MANACGCDHDPATWASQVEGACLRQRAQLTPLRRRVLDIFSGSAAPLGAYAILEELSRREGKQVAPPTVYRTLDFFLEHGFLHRIESLNTYARCAHFDHAHESALLICEKCGRSDEIEDKALASALDGAAQKLGFRPKRRMVEMIGLCRDCTKAA